VAFRVTTVATMFERDAVFTASAPSSHADSLARVGTKVGTTATHSKALPDSSRLYTRS
jgi:hypothetical protein